ncbi:unnamed protein product, partial [Allacma fusca]
MALTMEQLADKLLQMERRFETVQQENENMRSEIENLRKERDNWNNEEYADFYDDMQHENLEGADESWRNDERNQDEFNFEGPPPHNWGRNRDTHNHGNENNSETLTAREKEMERELRRLQNQVRDLSDFNLALKQRKEDDEWLRQAKIDKTRSEFEARKFDNLKKNIGPYM